MKRLKEDRSLLMFIVLGLITLGIYDLIFWWFMIEDLNIACEPKEIDYPEKSPNYIILVILTIITCGIYYYFWLYKQGNRIKNVGDKYGVRVDENGTTYLIWSLFGSLICFIGPFVGMYFLIKNINSLCRCYNREYVDGGMSYDSSANRYDGGYDNRGYDNRNNYVEQKDYDNRNGYGGVGAIAETEYGATLPTVGMQPGMIVCVKGSMGGARIPLQDREIVTIGRDGAVCNLILPEPDISRRHCTIQFIANKNCYYVTDYSSTGILMNGSHRLEKNTLTECQRGSRLLLGNGSNELTLQ